MSILANSETGEFRFGLLLVCLFGSVIIPPYFDGHIWFDLIWKLLFSLVLFAAIYSVMQKKKAAYWGWVLLVPTLITVWIDYFSDHNKIAIYLDNLTTIAFLTFICYHFLEDILKSKVVTINTIFASMCVYLMLASVFSAIFVNIHVFYGSAFQFNSEGLVSQAINDDTLAGVFHYYSFVTLTTLGYGDIIPTHRVAQAWVAVEAMIGQFYIAIILARLVSMHASMN